MCKAQAPLPFCANNTISTWANIPFPLSPLKHFYCRSPYIFGWHTTADHIVLLTYFTHFCLWSRLADHIVIDLELLIRGHHPEPQFASASFWMTFGQISKNIGNCWNIKFSSAGRGWRSFSVFFCKKKLLKIAKNIEKSENFFWQVAHLSFSLLKNQCWICPWRDGGGGVRS